MKASRICVIVLIVIFFGVGLIIVIERDRKNGHATHVTPKTVDSICTLTDYKQACMTTLTPLAHNLTSTPATVLNAAILAIVEAVGTAGASFVSFADNDIGHNQRLDDCKELMGYAVEELLASSKMLGNQTDLSSMIDKQPELMNFLSAVVAYQETCLDGFDNEPELRAKMENALLNATQLTSNALTIVASTPIIYKAFDHISSSTRGRKLLGTHIKGYPSWMSVDDQKLLGNSDVVLRPHAVVAKDGSGQFKTIMAALAAYPKGNVGRYVVYVKEGIYDEYVTVTKDQVNVFMFGDGVNKTIITGNRSNKTGWTTYKSATFTAIGSGFIAKSMGFQNTAGSEAAQAVALYSQSDRSAFFDVHIDGYQNTLYTHTHRQFYRSSIISGTVDFIFGDAAVIIQDCLIICKLPLHGQINTITAQRRKMAQETTGLVIQDCHIMADPKLLPTRSQVKSYLGRPLKEYSRTIVMESVVDDFIEPDGWLPWQGTFALDTCFYGEYANVGGGAGTDRRVKWKGFKVIKDKNEAMQYTAGAFVQGNGWLKGTGAPFYLGLKG